MGLIEDIRAEHVAVADTLESVGAGAPAGVEGWTAEDLAAHLRSQVGGLGLVLFGGRSVVARGVRLNDGAAKVTQRVLDVQRRRGFERNLRSIRKGPGPLLLRGRVAPVTLFEVWLHHDDLRRANGLTPGAEPASLGAAVDFALHYQREVLGDHEVDRSASAGDLLRWLGGRPSSIPPWDPPLRF